MTTYNTTKITAATGKAGEATGKLFNAIGAFLVKHEDDVDALPSLYLAIGPDITDSNKGKLVRSLWTMRGTDWCDMGGRSTFGWVGNIGVKPPITVKEIVKLAKAGTTSRDMVEALKTESKTTVKDPFTAAIQELADLPRKANGKFHANRIADVKAMIEFLEAGI